MQKAQFGMIGLGTMGRNLVLNMADHGFVVCGYDRNVDQQKRLSEEGKDKQCKLLQVCSNLLKALKHPAA